MVIFGIERGLVVVCCLVDHQSIACRADRALFVSESRLFFLSSELSFLQQW